MKSPRLKTFSSEYPHYLVFWSLKLLIFFFDFVSFWTRVVEAFFDFRLIGFWSFGFFSQIGEYKESEEVRQSHLENLREIEEALDAEFGGGSDENEESEDDDDSDFYCVFCEKTFKTRCVFALPYSRCPIDIIQFKFLFVEDDSLFLETSFSSNNNWKQCICRGEGDWKPHTFWEDNSLLGAWLGFELVRS